MITKTHTKFMNAGKELGKHQSVTAALSFKRLGALHLQDIKDLKCCTEDNERIELNTMLNEIEHNITNKKEK